MGERHHDRHTAGGKAQKVEALLLGAKATGTDVFDRTNAVVRINHLLTDLEGHAGTPFLCVDSYYGSLTKPLGILNLR